MRSGLILLWLLWSLCSFAQQKDSILLAPVTIYGLPEEKYLVGSIITPLDSALSAQSAASHLDNALSSQMPVYFRSYGNGMTSGISLRGTSPQHTAVLWNGININSFSHGQADFSILPVTAFDDIKVHAGGGSARFGSGAFGGTVLLNTDMMKDDAPLTITQEAASFGRYFSSVRATAGRGRLRLKTKVYHEISDNNFPVDATGERQDHAAFRQWGLLQDIAYHWSSSSSLQLHYWYHDADRDIQPSIGQYNNYNEQQDRNHRLALQFKKNGRHGLFSASGAYVNDVIVYNGSKSLVSRWLSAMKHQFTLPSQYYVQLGAEWNHITGDIREYTGGGATEDRFDFLGSVQKDFGRRLSLVINVRQPVVEGFSAPFLPYLGATYGLVKSAKHKLTLQGNVSRNYRMPTLNDRYWQNAGSKTVLPEESYAAEGGWTWSCGPLTLTNVWFMQKVDNWIQWVPAEHGDYQPRNVKAVEVRGTTVEISVVKRLSQILITSSLTYQLAESITKEAPPAEQYAIGKQLIYTPKHAATAYLHGAWKSYTATLSVQYNSVRYTDLSNAPTYALDAFALADISVGRNWLLNRHQINLNVSAKNVLAQEYQLYAGRAMPGRNYAIQLIYRLTPKQDEK